MRRSPFYAYPPFYAPPAEEAARRPFPPSSPAPAPTPRSSVINIPVFDSAPSRPSSFPPQKQPSTPPPSPPPASPVVTLIDPSSAATTIQSRFRGFCVRKHHPLLHLRYIAKARKQLEELQSELESPGFSLKVRASEKERLRFSESVMAIILRLDAIEGSMEEVRSQRKEATKMAIKLQDAVDAIMIQKEEIADLQPTDDPCSDGDMAPEEEQSEETCYPDADMARLLALKAEDVGQQTLSGELLMRKSGCFESVPQVKPAEIVYDAEQDMSHVTGENAASDVTYVAEEGVNSCIDALHVVAHNNHMQDQDTSMDDMKVANHGSAKGTSSDLSDTSMDVVQEFRELCPGTPTAGEKCSHPHYSTAAHQSLLHGPSIAIEANCYSDGKGSPTLHRHRYENCSEEAYPSDEVNPCDEAKAQSSTLSMVGTPPPPDSSFLHRLSEDCRQLKSLVGKLIVQNNAQSKVLCALSERLELLEHQQQLNCQHNQQQTRERRKLKKRSKRSVKCRNWE